MEYSRWVRVLLVTTMAVFIMSAHTVHGGPVLRTHRDKSSGEDGEDPDDASDEATQPVPPATTQHEYHNWDRASHLDVHTIDWSSLSCHLRPTQTYLHEQISDLKKYNIKLIEYEFTVEGYSDNPLSSHNHTLYYKIDSWSRVVTGQGQTILNLAFNYGILSLMTLTFGVEKLEVELADYPKGCLGKLSEADKVLSVLDITMKDLRPKSNFTVIEAQGSVCHQIIRDDYGVAKFTDRCCYRRIDNKGVECYVDIPNKWLETLDILLTFLMCAIFMFGPTFVPDWIYSDNMRNMEYSVILKEQLYKRIVVCRQDSSCPDIPEATKNIPATHTVDLRNKRDFIKCRRLLSEMPENKIIPVKIERFDITVNYRKLLQESKVPVGMIPSISRSIFLCKLRNLEPFRECCSASICGNCKMCNRCSKPWLSCCKLVGRIVLVLFMPFPFYVRLVLYYIFEHPEIIDRQAAAESLNLTVYYNYRLMQYLTPTHPVFIAAYIIYFIVGMSTAIYGGPEKDTRFHKAIVGAFTDFKDMTWLYALSVVVKNMLWPFKEYGLFAGCCIGLFIWPIFLPASVIVCFIYCLPMVFLTCRILIHLFTDKDEDFKSIEFETSVKKFEAEEMLRRLKNRRELKRRAQETCYCGEDTKRTLANVLMSFVILATLYSAMLMVAEVAGYLAEVACFTMMGLIVNASKVLRYGTLIFLVLIYSYDTYNNVNKKYLKLNKALFTEIQRRIKDLEEYTSLPSNLQENRGFKSCENNEQAYYESEDDISQLKECSWDINDLILFVDQDDTPRIPKKLFDQVCAVRVAGSPGPVYRSLLHATGKFFIIIMFLVFVFIVVMSFGESHKISTTNQTLATLAGGFLPFIFTNLLKPALPQVETGLVSFKSKLEEIIKNFHQVWPMYDFTFDVGVRPPDSDDEECDGEVTDDDNGSGLTENGHMLDLMQGIPLLGTNLLSCKCGSRTPNSRKPDSKKGDKEKNKNKSGLKPVIPFVVQDIKDRVDEMELEDALTPRPDSAIDIKLYVSDRDHEWLMSSSLDSIEKECLISMETKKITTGNYEKDTKV